MDEYINKNIIRDIIFNGISLDTDDDKLYAMELLNTVPPADVKPVVRGRWIPEDSGANFMAYKCSRCGSGGHTFKFNYCSSCGAKMKE